MLTQLVLAVVLAQAGTAFDPKDYIQQLPAEDKTPAVGAGTAVDDVRQAEVQVGGHPFVQFRSSFGTIFVPKVANLSAADLDRALCSNQVLKPKCDLTKLKNKHVGAELPAECRDEAAEDTTMLRVETPLASDWVAYTDLVLRTIQRACGGGQQNTTLTGGPGLEAGVEKKNPGRNPGGTKAFIRTGDPTQEAPSAKSLKSKPAVGAGISF